MTDAGAEAPFDDRPPYAPGETANDPEASPALPEMPLRPGPVSAEKRGGDFIVVFSTLSALAILTLIVIACSGGSPAVLILLFSCAFFIAFHYLLWGWWLGKSIRRRTETEDDG